jgi:glycerol-3-phosphate acyltransferase PlsY
MIATAVAAAAYLLGAIPFSFLIARVFGVRDVRRVGSGNVGATKVLRSAGKIPGTLAFLLDALKGAAAAELAATLFPNDGLLPALAAVAAVIGHMYPFWLRFQGGKGVATGFGAFLTLAPWAALAGIVTFVAVAALTRYVSLGSVAGAGALPLVALILGGPGPVPAAAAFTAVLVIFRHRSNLSRILGGTERRTGAAEE